MVQGRGPVENRAAGRAEPSCSAAGRKSFLPQGHAEPEGVRCGSLLVRSQQRTGQGEKQKRHFNCCR